MDICLLFNIHKENIYKKVNKYNKLRGLQCSLIPRCSVYTAISAMCDCDGENKCWEIHRILFSRQKNTKKVGYENVTTIDNILNPKPAALHQQEERDVLF